MKNNDLQKIDWMGFDFEVPLDWEILRHAIDPNKGSVVLVDRRTQLLTITWFTFEKRPDTRQIISDSKNRDLERFPGATFKSLSNINEWSGYFWNDNESVVTRWGHFDSKNNRWIDLVFTWPSVRNEKIECEILHKFHCSKINKSSMRWRAFGIDIKSPSGWKLSKATVLPGECTFKFENKKASFSITKSKSVNDWLNEELDSYLKRALKLSNKPLRSVTVNCHKAYTITKLEKEPQLRWLRGDIRSQVITSWICPITNALYQKTIIAQRPEDVNSLDWHIHCCNPGEPII